MVEPPSVVRGPPTRALLPNLTTDQLALVIDGLTRRFLCPYLNPFFCALTVQLKLVREPPVDNFYLLE